MLAHAARTFGRDADELDDPPNHQVALRRPLLSASADQAIHHNHNHGPATAALTRRTGSGVVPAEYFVGPSSFDSSVLATIGVGGLPTCLLCGSMRARITKDTLQSRSGSAVLELSRHGSLQHKDEDAKRPTRDTLTDKEVSTIISELPPWTEQLTLRGLLVAIILGGSFCIITMKLNFGSAGINPSLNIPGGLLSFILVRAFTRIGAKLNLTNRFSFFGRFTPQENAVIQTMTSACYNIAGYAGFGSYLLAMSYQTYLNTGGVPKGQEGYNPDVIYEPVLSRIYPYLALICFAGIFVLISMRQLMIIKWRLPYPSGTASGHMVRSLHTEAGEEDAVKKLKLLSYTAISSFVFDLFKWFWQGADYSCGFMIWPTFGPQALKWTWNFDSQQQYIGAGMLVPHVVAWSMLLGAILSWGVMWPLINEKAGDWYPQGLNSKDFKGLFGYKVWLTIALLMGEGMYMLVKALWMGGQHFGRYMRERSYTQLPVHHSNGDAGAVAGGASSSRRARAHGAAGLDHHDALKAASNLKTLHEGADEGGSHVSDGAAAAEEEEKEEQEDGAAAGIAFVETPGERKLRTAVFNMCTMPWWMAPLGYCLFSVVGILGIPHIYPPCKWYMVLVAYIMGPFIALPNAYGAGLTDQDNCSMYAKLALFIFSAWAGVQGNGVIAGCAICGVIMVSTTNAAVLMQDMRTAYITLASPRAMVYAQVIGVALGVVLTPLAFQLFWKTGLIGLPEGPYPNPFADIYRGMAIIGTEGFSALPKYCGLLTATFFVAAQLICLLRDLLPPRYAQYVVSPMGLGFSFYIGANNALDFWLGTVIMHLWEWVDDRQATEYGPLAAAGLIVGDGVWAIPSAFLAIANINPPMCMRWTSS